MKRIAAIFVFLAFIGCQEKKSEHGTALKEGDFAETETYDDRDTITVRGNSIVFFAITPDEYEAIVEREGKDSGIDEVLDGFSQYASEASDSLSEAGYETILTASKTFECLKDNGQKSYLTWDAGKGKVGVAVFDGRNEPKLDYGIKSEEDIYRFVNNYFRKKKP
jgi:hypothetical protein